MTEKEALGRTVDYIKRQTENERLYYSKDENLDFAKTVKIALEKQIPKKPHKNYEKVNLKWCECGNYLGELKNEQNYCKRCGQALDWGEEE